MHHSVRNCNKVVLTRDLRGCDCALAAFLRNVQAPWSLEIVNLYGWKTILAAVGIHQNCHSFLMRTPSRKQQLDPFPS